jgi:hypothetical protein
MQWPANASLGPTTLGTAKSGQSHLDVTEQRRDRMVPIIVHTANTIATRAIWPPEHVSPCLRGRDLALDTRPEPFCLCRDPHPRCRFSPTSKSTPRVQARNAPTHPRTPRSRGSPPLNSIIACWSVETVVNNLSAAGQLAKFAPEPHRFALLSSGMASALYSTQHPILLRKSPLAACFPMFWTLPPITCPLPVTSSLV